jgi:hypothetical protein
LLLFLLVDSFATAMLRADHNEHMYVTAGALLADGKALYTDFPHLQMPLLPHLYSALYRLSGESHFLLKAKVFTWIAWVAGVLALYWLSRIWSGDWLWSLAIVLLFLVNRHLARTLHEASNYALPIAASLASLAVAARGLRRDRRPLLFLVSGFLTGIGFAAKAYHVVVAPPLAVGLCFAAGAPTFAARLRRQALPFACGFAIGTLPVLYYAVNDFELFWFQNFEFHRLTTLKYADLGYPRAMDVPGKIEWFLETQSSASTIGLGVLLVASLSLAVRGRNRTQGSEPARRDPGSDPAILGILVATVCLTCIAVFAMTPVWPQYLALPMPYLLLLVGALRSRAGSDGKLLITGLALVCFLACLRPAEMYQRTRDALDPENWYASQVRAGAAEIRGILESKQLTGRIATLQPLWAVEAGLPIYEEFATGPFIFAVGDRMNDRQRERVVVTSPRYLEDRFGKEPPAAILTGFYGRDILWEETALTRYARLNGYAPVRVVCGGKRARLFLRR